MTIVTDFVVPPIGVEIDSARLVRWLVMPGQAFGAGDIVVEIETDKSIVEVPAPQPGVMVEHLIHADGILNADTVIARVQREGDEAPTAMTSSPMTSDSAGGEPAQASAAAAAAPERREPRNRAVGRRVDAERTFSTPAARRVAHERGISVENIEGTGAGGRITQSDVTRLLGGGGLRSTDRTRGARESYVATSFGDIGVTVWEPASVRTDSTFVLVHGMFGDRDTWTGIADALVRSGVRIAAIDLPCHGRSKSEATSFVEIVDCVAEVASRVCAGSMVLVGHSFGGAVAARMVRKPTLRVSALALIAPMGMGTQIEQTFLDGMVYADSDEAMLRELRKLTASGMTPSIGYVQQVRGAVIARRDHLVKLIRQVTWNGNQQLDTVPDLLGAECPTLLIQGRRDAIIPWEQALNAPPRVALHLLPDAGHMPHWESTTLTSSIILDSVVH